MGPGNHTTLGIDIEVDEPQRGLGNARERLITRVFSVSQRQRLFHQPSPQRAALRWG